MKNLVVRNILIGISIFSLAVFFLISCQPQIQQVEQQQITPLETISYDLVINNGRVINPETNTDDILNIGITNGKIKTVSHTLLRGKKAIDATNLVVVPGFIDMNNHGTDELNYDASALDGVTTALELEVGTTEVDRWYAMRRNRARINYGSSVSHALGRSATLGDPSSSKLQHAFSKNKLFLTQRYLPTADGRLKPASDKQINRILRLLQVGLDQGALGIGATLGLTPGASSQEFIEVTKLAARNSVGVFAQGRFASVIEPNSSHIAFEEIIANNAMTGANMHFCQINVTGLKEAHKLLGLLKNAQSRDLPLSTEVSPYNQIEFTLSDPIFTKDWQSIFGIDYTQLTIKDSGEILAKQKFEKLLKDNPNTKVIAKILPQDVLDQVVADNSTVIVSGSALSLSADGTVTGHPSSSGSFARVLREYVREKKILTLGDAIYKMTLLPAKILESTVPSMKLKGRIAPDADADITIFSPETVTEKSDFNFPEKSSEGFRYVIVNGIPIVLNGTFEKGVLPGQPVRNPTML